ncbi:FAST kinase domain-containing protein 5, mitochondrial-like [Lineus longissimus]|uniref:FAST kinase domain-containing protein 5, mitochondrial-like n=1 Tax=Lineus longissimus TaxID=88925 RepID=UPI002B4F5B15
MLRIWSRAFTFGTGRIAQKCALSTTSVFRRSEKVTMRPKLRTNRSRIGEGMQRRLEDMKQNSGLPKYISEKMHEGLRSIVPSDYIYTRPVGLSFDLITSHLVDRYENVQTREEKLNFLETLSDLELQRLLVLVGQQHPNKSEPTDILDSLIIESCRRFRYWDTRTLLYTSDIVFQIDCVPKLFYRRLISHVSGQWSNLNLSSLEILQLLFYMAYLGETSEQLMLKIENKLTENIQDFEMEYLSILCSAFFVVNRRVKSPELVDWIAKSTLENFDSLPRHQINNALKVLRHASYQNPNLFDSLGAKYHHQYKDTLSVGLLKEVMEPLRCYASLRIYNKDLLSLVRDTFTELQSKKADLTGLRSKDFSYLLWALAVFDYKPDIGTLGYLADWLRTLQQRGDFDTYPESLVNGVMALVLMDYFPEDLISTTLESKLLNRIRVLRHMDKYYHLLIIDASTSIQCPDYKGFQLPKGFINNLPNSVLGKINTELEGRAGLHAVFSAIRDIFIEEDLVQCHFILPHFHTASIEIHLDAENRPMKLPFQDVQRDFATIYEGLFRSKNGHQRHSKGVAVTSQLLQGLCGQNGGEDQKIAVAKPARRIAIEILGWNQVCYNKQERQLITSEIKQRHLRKLGFEVILIHPGEAHSMQDYSLQHLHQYAEDKIMRPLNIQL